MKRGLILGILLLGLASPARGARYPNSVAKSFSVRGSAAIEWVKILGMNPDQAQTLQLPLSQMEVHAQGLGVGTPSAQLANQISYDPKTQNLTLSGDWLDQSTGSNKGSPRFTFSSGFLREDLSQAGTWGDLLKAWGFPKKQAAEKKFGEVLAEKSSNLGSFPVLHVEIYQSQSWEADPKGIWGYQMVIGVDE